jgi:phosphohistidine phosphatase
MALYLVQHGKSLSKDQDPDQGLSPIGMDETRRMAILAAEHNVNVHRIHHSTKTRARQTAEIFAQVLDPIEGVHVMEGIKPMDDVTSHGSVLTSEENLMLVGHLPFMARLASYLITGGIEPPVFAFQNSGIVCLDKPVDDGNWLIVWSLMPHLG